MERKSYSPESLARALGEFERAFGRDSETFYAQHLADDVPGVPRFECAVWATFYEESQRMRSGEPVMDRVSRAFAAA